MAGPFESFAEILSGAKERAQAAEAAAVFNRYHQWHDGLEPCDPQDFSDIVVGGVRYRGFCGEDLKQSMWNVDWRSKNPQWGPVSAGTTVSSDPAEVWYTLKQIGGLMTPNPAIVGHETQHLLSGKDPRIINPDLLINPESYKKPVGGMMVRKK